MTVVTLYVLTNDDKMMMEGLMRLICLLGIFIGKIKRIIITVLVVVVV